MFKLSRIKLILSSLLNVIFAIIKNMIRRIMIIRIILSRFIMLKIRVNIIQL